MKIESTLRFLSANLDDNGAFECKGVTRTSETADKCLVRIRERGKFLEHIKAW